MNDKIHVLRYSDGAEYVLSDAEVEHLQLKFAGGSFEAHKVQCSNGTTPWVVMARMTDCHGYFRYLHRGGNLFFIEKSKALQVCGQLSVAAQPVLQA